MSALCNGGRIQPATHWVDDHSGKRFHFRFPARKLIYCYKCGRRRWAAKMLVLPRYDSTLFFCRDTEYRRGAMRCKR